MFFQQTNASLKASYEVSLMIDKQKEAHILGENLVLPAAKVMVRCVFGDESVKKVNSISLSNRRRRRRLKGIHSRSGTNMTGAEGLFFYNPRLLHCLDQTLTVMSLSQHRVSSSKIVRPRAPCGTRCIIGHAVSTWSAVCSEAPHSQFGEGARPHLCMDE